MPTLADYWADDRYTKDGIDELLSTDFTGQTIEILGPWRGIDEVHFSQVTALFEELTGADIIYTGPLSFENEVIQRSTTGDSADISIFPQPGLLEALVYSDGVEQISGSFGEWMRQNYTQGDYWADLVSFDHGASDQTDVYGLVYNVGIKSTVWYSKSYFDSYNITLPSSYEELIDISNTISGNGDVAWSMPLGSGAATGWPGTDWIEDIILQTEGSTFYDAWVEHKISFDDPRVIDALNDFKLFVQLAQDSGVDLSSVGFWDGLNTLSAGGQGVMLHSPSFTRAWWPDGAVLDQDLSLFSMPVSLDQQETGTLVGGGLVAVTNDRNFEVSETFLKYLTLPIAHEIWLAQQQTGFLTPLTTVNNQIKTLDGITSSLTDILWNAEVVRFDGSDLMPAEIGTDVFWSEIVSFTDHLDPALLAQRLDDAWPLETVRTYRGYEESNTHLFYGSGAAEEIIGGDGTDILYGGGGNDMVLGGGGNDRIVAGSGQGDDTYYGGDGDDLITFQSSRSGLRIDLELGIAESLNMAEESGTGKDTIFSIEHVLGGLYGDYIVGDDATNLLNGSAGDDWLFGGNGDDQLIGGEGNDILFGASGADTYRFIGEFGNDFVVGFDSSEDSITIVNSEGAALLDSGLVKSVNENGLEVWSTLDGLSSLTFSAVQVFAKDTGRLVTVGDVRYQDTAGETKLSNLLNMGPTNSYTGVSLSQQTLGAVGISDVIAQLRHIVGLNELTGVSLGAADSDGNGLIGISDVIGSLRQIVGLEKAADAKLVTADGRTNFDFDQSVSELYLVAPGDADLSWDVSGLL